MNWTTPADLRAQLQRLWDKGEILASLVSGEPLFPRRLSLKRPSSSELSGDFEAARAWISALRAQAYIRVELREIRHRVLGNNLLPDAVWVDTLDDALAWLGKQRAGALFQHLLDDIRRQQPSLLPWLTRRPLQVLDLAEAWPRLLAVVQWLQHNPRPGIYLRQVDLPGIDSKFIEAHRAVLGEWLDLALSPQQIDATATGVGGFAQRYGFCDLPQRIRFRILDPRRSLLPGGLIQDIKLDAASFAALGARVSRVYVTENEINFLAFPELADSMVIFGAGYGFEAMRQAAWLQQLPIHYWGDIDTHGFAILDQLRAYFPQVQSLLMDRATLLQFAPLWGEEHSPTLRDLPRLTIEERALYDDLRDNRLGRHLRLEQERIGFNWVMDALAQVE